MNFDLEQKKQFDETGLLLLKGHVSKKKTLRIRDGILDELTRLGLRENGKWKLGKFDGLPPFQVTTKIGQKLRFLPDYDALIPQDLLPALNELAGCELNGKQAQKQILVTPPQKETWSIPQTGWHVDVATRDPIPGIQIFLLLDEVLPHGGGTLALEASHRDRKLLPTEDRVREMSGNAGDIYLMDMRVLHAPSINASKNTRMMLTIRYLRKGE